MMNEPISSIMTKDLMTLRPDSTLTDIKELFINHRIHHIPIVDDNQALMGLVTTFDLFKLNVEHKDYDRIKVGAIMTKKLAVLSPEDKIGSAAELFLLNRFHAVPLVKEGKLVGLCTTFDVLKYEFKKAYPNQEID